MRFRFAAGMLLIIVLHPPISFTEGFLNRPGVSAGDYLEGLRDFLIGPDGLPARTRFALIVRLLILVAVVVIAITALAASSASVALLVGGASIVLAVLNLQFLIWAWNFASFDDLPPDWLLRNPLWFPVPRIVALGWILLLIGAAILSFTSTQGERTSARGRSFAPPPPPPTPANQPR
jgi:hypothetical protein